MKLRIPCQRVPEACTLLLILPRKERFATDARNRFRWAVCQIDVLQRLKCERSIVEKALRNLPKTLEETYDRILLALPEEDRLSVQHILHWISYDNEMYQGEGASCEFLVQAVRKSTAELIVDGLERFYDDETLRELCGCLIRIIYKEQDTTGIVSFAHYTVREYLDSSRSKIYIGSQGLRQRFLIIVFSEALHIGPNELQEWYDTLDNNDLNVSSTVRGNLNGYYLVSAFLSLFRWPNEISRCETLCTLAIDFLDPSKTHFEPLGTAIYAIDDIADLSGLAFDQLHLLAVSRFSETSNMVAAHLLLLLALVQAEDKYLFLAKKFLKAKDTMDLFQARLRFVHPLWVESEDGFVSYIFDGSIIEVFAQLAVEGSYAFKLLMDHGAGLFDCTKILLLYIFGHHHESGDHCVGDCPLRRLLEFGADPNCSGYRITPLHIAVVSRDLAGVRTLLDVGADPNDTGSIGGTFYEEDTYMAQFNRLHGASALHIFRNFKVIDKYFGRAIEEDSETIEAILLDYGAEEILTMMNPSWYWCGDGL